MFSVALKDYLDHLHDLSLLTDFGGTFDFIKATFSYGFQSLVLALYYIFSFHWLRDFIELPVMFKQNYNVIMEGQTVLRRSSEWRLSLNNGAYGFLDVSPLNTKSIFSGYLNSFFLCLPLTFPHILSMRALLVNGVPAGIASSLGTLCGQLVFFICVLFGFEWILQPFFQGEVFVILGGIILTIEIIFKLGRNPNYMLISIVDRKQLNGFFRLNFILAWLEQICVCNYFGNLTATNSASLLETSDHHWLFMTLTYLFGLTFGCVVWSILFAFAFLKLRHYISDLLPNLTFHDITERIHYSCLAGLAIMSMSTFFYYGYDFFGAKALGYVEEDAVLENVSPVYRSLIDLPEEISESEEDPPALIFDSKPFHIANYRPESPFETYGILSEQSWYNRDYTLERVNEKTGLFREENKGLKAMQRQPYKENKRLSAPRPRHVAKNLNDEFWLIEPGSRELTIFEDVMDSVFRHDTYYPFKSNKDDYEPETQVTRIFREKYYSNPLYNGLMKINNYGFLSGQPQTSNLSASDEHELYKRRVKLQNYLNTISKYKKILRKRDVAFPEKVYNQQFKGSLDFIRSFNAVQLTEYGSQEDNRTLNPETEPKNKVLKYDQPLYKKFSDEQKALLHEELKLRKRDLRPRRFLSLNDTRPLYIGWDNSLRKFMIKSARVGSGFDDGALAKENETAMVDDKDAESGKQTKKTVRVKKGLPDYYHFQAWSPGVETVNNKTKFKLPSLVASENDVKKIQDSLELITVKEEDFYVNEGTPREIMSARASYNFRSIAEKTALKRVFNHLPLYDWYWKALSIAEDDEETQKVVDSALIQRFRIGDAVPPKLDGVAWPGQNPRRGLKDRDPYMPLSFDEQDWEYDDD